MTPLTPMNNAIAETKSAEAQAISEACQIDASITQALQTLASVGAPPPGMEDRILNRLRQHAQPGPATLQRRLASLIPQLSIAAAATACIVAAILVLHPNLHPSEASAIATAFTLSPTLSQPGSKPQLQPHSPAQPPTQLQPQPELYSVPTPEPHPIRHSHPAAATPVSFPAPPEPLTEQERLLLSIAQNPTPEVIAALDPVQRAEAAARSEQRFLASLEPTDPNASSTTGDPQ